MPFSIVNTSGTLLLKLEGAITIRQAQDLAARLGESLDDLTPVVVDTAGLEDIDTCILQLLYSLRRRGPALSFEDPSENFLDAVDRCGLRRELLIAREIS
jgi:anti-anti-sigma regulatory factor